MTAGHGFVSHPERCPSGEIVRIAHPETDHGEKSAAKRLALDGLERRITDTNNELHACAQGFCWCRRSMRS